MGTSALSGPVRPRHAERRVAFARLLLAALASACSTVDGPSLSPDAGLDATPATDSSVRRDARGDARCVEGGPACDACARDGCACTTCGGPACVDTSTDPANCGSCGRRCATFGFCVEGLCACPAGDVACGGVCVEAGAACTDSAGACAGTYLPGGRCLVVLASGQTPDALALDSSRVYWTNSGTTDANGSLASVPIGGGAPTTLASGLDSPFGVAVYGGDLYWTNVNTGPDGTLLRMPVGGGPSTTYFTGDLAAVDGIGLAASAAGVTVGVGSAALLELPLAGGAATTLATGSPFGVAVDAVNAYFTTVNCGDHCDIVKVPLAGGATTTLATDQALPGAIATDGVNVYWGVVRLPGVDGGLDGAILSVPVTGGAPVTLATGQAGPRLGIAVDPAYVYWTDYDGGFVVKAPIAGGSPTTLAFFPPSQYVRNIAVDSASVYFTTVTEVLKITPK